MALGDRTRLRNLKRRMAALPGAVRLAMMKATVEGAEDLAKSMRALAPVDTGALRESIVVTPGGQRTPPYSQPGGSYAVPENSAMVTAGDTDVRYPHLVEYGTKDAHAQPFFWPAVRSKKKKIANRVKRATSKAAREAWKK